MEKEVILVFGATGHQGGAVVKHLLIIQESKETDFKIRALVRNASSEAALQLEQKGIELVEGAMEDLVPLKRALEGVTRVFFHTTHNTFQGEEWEAEAQRGIVVVQELAKSTTLQQVIYSTLPSIQGYHESLGKVKIEEEMRQLKLPLTTVLAPFYLENFINIWPPIRKWFGLWGALEWGWLPTDKALRMPHGSVRDFGVVVANVLRLPVTEYLNRKITVVAEDLLLEEVLKELEKGIGERIAWRPLKKSIFWQLPFPKQALSGLAFYADRLANLEQVEIGFLKTVGEGPQSLAAAKVETQELYPLVQSVAVWGTDNQKVLTGSSLRKTTISLLLSWAKMKSLFKKK